MDLPGLAHFCEHMNFMGSKKVCRVFTRTLSLSVIIPPYMCIYVSHASKSQCCFDYWCHKFCIASQFVSGVFVCSITSMYDESDNICKNVMVIVQLGSFNILKMSLTASATFCSFIYVQCLCPLLLFLPNILFPQYPSEACMFDIVTPHGGMTNAYTDKEDTNFHFDVDPAHFKETLDV